VEQLEDPVGVLRRLKGVLRADGCVVACVSDAGMRQLFELAGFAIGHLERMDADLDAVGVPTAGDAAAVKPRAASPRDREAPPNHFVLVAYPLPGGGLERLQRRMGDLAAEREAARQELAQLRPLRERLVRQRQGIDSLHRYLREELARRDTQVGERDEIIRGLQAELHAKVGDCNRVIHELQARLEMQALPVGGPECPDGEPVAGLDREAGELARQVRDLQAQLDGIQRARLWSVVTGYWALRQKLRRFVRRK
jgi:hypothetical protein